MYAAFRAPDHVGELSVAEEDGDGVGKQPPLAHAPPSSGNAIHVNGKGAVSRDF